MSGSGLCPMHPQNVQCLRPVSHVVFWRGEDRRGRMTGRCTLICAACADWYLLSRVVPLPGAVPATVRA